MSELLPHSIKWEQRKRGELTGVREVIAFDEQEVQIDTTMGVLTVSGTGLQVKHLSLENGKMEIEGTVERLVYSESREEKGKNLFRRMFG